MSSAPQDEYEPAEGVVRWNYDKKHRCPECHAVAVDMEKPRSLAVYECCRCHTRFARWPWLSFILPKRGIRCSEHRNAATSGTGRG